MNGGTGISARDRTYEAVAGLLEKRLDGFTKKHTDTIDDLLKHKEAELLEV